jgi:hypothetical protein
VGVGLGVGAGVGLGVGVGAGVGADLAHPARVKIIINPSTVITLISFFRFIIFDLL